MKEIIRFGKLCIELDPQEIFPDDPGQGAPCMVYKDKHSATYNCALDTGELDLGEYTLSTEEWDWLASQSDRVDSWLDSAYNKLTNL